MYSCNIFCQPPLKNDETSTINEYFTFLFFPLSGRSRRIEVVYVFLLLCVSFHLGLKSLEIKGAAIFSIQYLSEPFSENVRFRIQPHKFLFQNTFYIPSALDNRDGTLLLCCSWTSGMLWQIYSGDLKKVLPESRLYIYLSFFETIRHLPLPRKRGKFIFIEILRHR